MLSRMCRTYLSHNCPIRAVTCGTVFSFPPPMCPGLDRVVAEFPFCCLPVSLLISLRNFSFNIPLSLGFGTSHSQVTLQFACQTCNECSIRLARLLRSFFSRLEKSTMRKIAFLDRSDSAVR